jgi:protein SCO1/2
MTMSFAVTRPAEAAALQVGDRVRFQLHVGETSSRIEDLQPVGRETASAAPRRGPAVNPRRVREGDAVPEFSLIDHEGAPLTAAALRGHFTVMTFIFTRCPVPEFCPAMTSRFARLQKEILGDPSLASRVRLLSVSFDPEFDRPETLKAYGTAVGADAAVWKFATGEPAAVETLTKAFAVFVERGGVTLNHTLCTVLIGPDRRVVAIWRGNGWNTDDVLRAIASEDAPRE